VPGGNNFGTRVFWTAAVPDGDVIINPVSRAAEMHIHNLAALDYPEDFGGGSLGPNWQTAYVPASISFDVVWTPPVNRRVTVSDATDQFAGTFNEDQATVVWSARSASGFEFHSRPGNASTSTPGSPNILTAYFFAQIGHERNGIFFSAGADKSDQLFVSGNAPAPVENKTILSNIALFSWQPVQQATSLLPQSSVQADGQPTQSSSEANWTDSSVHLGMLDQVFADLENSSLWNAFLGGDV
jgi:hypothetical protein